MMNPDATDKSSHAIKNPFDDKKNTTLTNY